MFAEEFLIPSSKEDYLEVERFFKDILEIISFKPRLFIRSKARVAHIYNQYLGWRQEDRKFSRRCGYIHAERARKRRNWRKKKKGKRKWRRKRGGRRRGRKRGRE